MEHARQFYIDGAWVDPGTPKLLDVADVREFGAWGLDELLKRPSECRRLPRRRRTSVTRGAPSISLRHGATSLPSVVPVQFRPVLVTHAAVPAETTAPKRTRLWEFNTNLHCSIVGTCLSTGELRQIVTRAGLATPSSTDHELHGTAVLLSVPA